MARRPPQDPSEQHEPRSVLRDPVGPEDRSVYVRRRLIVLLGLVAVIATIVLIVVRPGSSTPSDTKDVKVPSDVAETPKADPKKAGEPVACAQSALEVVPVTDQGSYGEGEYPQLSLTVKNTGKDACVADLGTAGMSFTVSSGSDDVWRSTDCQTGAESLPVVLKPGETLESEAIPWDRTRSSTETCEITRDPVVAGGASYHLSAGAGGAEGEETAQFLLY
ncbi:hypothetical protein FB468_1484 [Leucobacter komagatae]|uniref:DUF4232 domain-containing protein n=1 Tax=Leucobacter komagatae TaxID=55969 RepID=A0A542Y5Z1_9MICO|nr:hypothetical protein [Leucobacter komagatae]TQL43463.1 hypothetical protein FB468_1484 [Leucobacter komagatae]